MSWMIDREHPENKWMVEKQNSTLANLISKGASNLSNEISNIPEYLSNVPGISSIANLLEKPASKINEFVESARLPSIAGGVLQGASDVGISALNLPLEMLGKEKIPHANFGQYLPQDPTSRAAYLGGNVVGAAIPSAGIYRLMSKALPELSGSSRLISDIGRGSVTGFIEGEEAPAGRAGGALIGTVASGANLLRPSVLAKKIVDTKNKVQKYYSSEYKNLFNTATNNEMGTVSVPKITANQIKLMENNIPAKYIESTKKFFSNPTTENAHWAQSDLKRYVDKNSNRSFPSGQTKALNLANKTQKDINSEISKILSKNPELNLNETYKNLSQGYRHDVIPMKHNPSINAYIRNKKSAKNMMDDLSKNDEFMINAGHNFPELKLSNFVNNPYVQAGVAGAAGTLGLNKIFDNTGNTINYYNSSP